jgi:hypothetical protein
MSTEAPSNAWDPPAEPPVDKVDTVDPKFVQCRVGVLGHAWTHQKPRLEPDGRVIALPSRCSNCGTRRTKRMTTGGIQVGSPRYEHPEGYLVKSSGTGRKATNDAWRGRFVRDALGPLTRGGE